MIEIKHWCLQVHFFSFICLNFRLFLPEKESYCSSPPCLPVGQAAQPGDASVWMCQTLAASVPSGEVCFCCWDDALPASSPTVQLTRHQNQKSREVLQSPERRSLSPNKMFGELWKWCIFLCELSVPFNEVLQWEFADGRFQFSV